MAMAGLEVFDKTMQQTQMWVDDVARELGWDDKHKTFLGLRATLHTLRDRLTLGEAANLGSQLPILLSRVLLRRLETRKYSQKSANEGRISQPNA